MSKQIAHWILVLPALFIITAVHPEPALSDGTQVRLQTDLEYIYSDVEREVKSTGEETQTDFSYLKQKYNLELLNQLYPYLKLRGGGHFELIDSETDTDGVETDFRERTGRAFGEIDFSNPLHSAGAAYRYREFNFSPSGFDSTKIVREEYSGLWHWRPVALPSLDVDYNNFRTRDEDRTRDVAFQLLILKSLYDYQDLHTDYTYTLNDRDEKIAGDGLLTQVHNAGVRYGREFFDERLDVNVGGRVIYDQLEPQGAGEIKLPTDSRGAPFYYTDDRDPSTLTVVDAANPLSNVNIGRDGPLHPVSVGLDFGPPTQVDTIRLLPLEDASDPTQASPGEIDAVAGGFVWTVFVSDDQVDWTEVLVTSVEYDVFDNYFEITFLPGVETRYVKVVTSPITNASGEIRIEVIQSFTTSTTEPGEKRRTINQTYNLGLNWMPTDRTTATFESFLRLRDDDFQDRNKSTFTNALGVQHDISAIFYADARVLRTDTIETGRDDVTRHTYTASLGADYLPALQQRLIYSGTHESEDDRSGHTNAIILRTNADLYRNWSANLDIGYSARDPIIGPEGTSTSFRLTTNMTPHQSVNVTVDYLGSWDTQSDRPSTFNQIAKFQAFWVPVKTLSFFGGINLRDDQRNQRGLSVIQNYTANWTIFPDGTLDLNLAYNHRIDSRGAESRILTPQLKWQMLRTALLTLTFDYGMIESESDIRDVKSIRVNFRLYY